MADEIKTAAQARDLYGIDDAEANALTVKSRELNAFDPAKMLSLKEIRELDEKYVLQTYARMPVAFHYGAGDRLYDTEGKEYIDFLSGIAVTALGHAHSDLIAALNAQAEMLWHTSNLFFNQQQAQLARALVETLTQHFPEFRGLPVVDLPYIEAACDHTFDGTRYTARCRAEAVQVEVVWEDLLDQKYLNWPQFPAGPLAYDLSTVICPCRTGRVTLNGTAVPGEVLQANAADGSPSSTAFLAFAESWVGPV